MDNTWHKHGIILVFKNAHIYWLQLTWGWYVVVRRWRIWSSFIDSEFSLLLNSFPSWSLVVKTQRIHILKRATKTLMANKWYTWHKVVSYLEKSGCNTLSTLWLQSNPNLKLKLSEWSALIVGISASTQWWWRRDRADKITHPNIFELIKVTKKEEATTIIIIYYNYAHSFTW